MLKRNLSSLRVPAVGMGTASSSGFDVDSPEVIETWGQAALAWLLADSRVPSLVIPATSRPQRIGENAAAGSVIIPCRAATVHLQRGGTLPMVCQRGFGWYNGAPARLSKWE